MTAVFPPRPVDVRAATLARAAAADKAAAAAIDRAATLPLTPAFDELANKHGYDVWPPHWPTHEDHMAAVDQTGWVADLLSRLELLRHKQAAVVAAGRDASGRFTSNRFNL